MDLILDQLCGLACRVLFQQATGSALDSLHLSLRGRRIPPFEIMENGWRRLCAGQEAKGRGTALGRPSPRALRTGCHPEALGPLACVCVCGGDWLLMTHAQLLLFPGAEDRPQQVRAGPGLSRDHQSH